MITKLSRIVHFGLNNFWRNGLLSTATVAITVLALVVSLGLVVFNQVTDVAIQSVQDKIDISVYFNSGTSADTISNIKKTLESMPEVKEARYISKEEALEIFKKQHQDDDSISQAINLVEDNPLEPSLNIKAYEPDQYEGIAKTFENPNIKQYVTSVSYYENKPIIDKLSKIIANVNRGGLVLVIFLIVVAGLIVFNTIRLAIYSSRDEIAIMRAVGASNMLVRGPFLVDGIITGALAACLSLIIALPVISFVAPYLDNFIPGLDLFHYFYSNIFFLLGLQLLFGVGISIISSFLAVRRYLKN
jgi:cell division transport system permease protein